MILLGYFAEFLNGFIDSFDDKRKDRILGVIHFSLFNTDECQFEDIGLDLLLIVLISHIDTFESLFHDIRNDFVLVDVLQNFSFLKDVFCSVVKVVLEGNLF